MYKEKGLVWTVLFPTVSANDSAPPEHDPLRAMVPASILTSVSPWLALSWSLREQYQRGSIRKLSFKSLVLHPAPLFWPLPGPD